MRTLSVLLAATLLMTGCAEYHYVVINFHGRTLRAYEVDGWDGEGCVPTPQQVAHEGRIWTARDRLDQAGCVPDPDDGHPLTSPP